jgi:bifunctional DNA primase/polymerase-like protein
MTTAEVCRLALNLARNASYAVFPQRLTRDGKKVPTTPNGFYDASKDPDAIKRLWREHPGPLIGIATGARSGVSVVDIDQKHRPAFMWWVEHVDQLLPTRCFRSRSGGLHLYYTDPQGVIRCSTGGTNRLPRGVDTKGEGGCATYWFATGLECKDHSPPAPWPAWLAAAITKPEPPPFNPKVSDDRAIDGLIKHVATTKEGNRNAWRRQRDRAP